MSIPRRAAELIIGRDGAIAHQVSPSGCIRSVARQRYPCMLICTGSLFQLMTQSHAHIEVSAAPDGGGHRELTIKGSPAQVRQTQQLLHGILQGAAALMVELHFPARSMGRIIGNGGAGDDGRHYTEWPSPTVLLTRIGAVICIVLYPPLPVLTAVLVLI